jgi:hypothetical protein
MYNAFVYTIMHIFFTSLPFVLEKNYSFIEGTVGLIYIEIGSGLVEDIFSYGMVFGSRLLLRMLEIWYHCPTWRMQAYSARTTDNAVEGCTVNKILRSWNVPYNSCESNKTLIQN